jgi:hypothetical protein
MCLKKYVLEIIVLFLHKGVKIFMKSKRGVTSEVSEFVLNNAIHEATIL